MSAQRRNAARTFLVLLIAQTIAAPLGACVLEHADGHSPDSAAISHSDGHHEAMTMGSAGPAEATESRHDHEGTPLDCQALAACGVAAIGAIATPGDLVIGDQVLRGAVTSLEEPAAIVLGLLTPPPKI